MHFRAPVALAAPPTISAPMAARFVVNGWICEVDDGNAAGTARFATAQALIVKYARPQ